MVRIPPAKDYLEQKYYFLEMTTFRSNFARSFLGGAEKNRKSV
jgi:hypothetical protein